MSIIWILVLRQLKRYARARARIIGSLGQPLLFLVAMGFGFGPMYAKAGGGNYARCNAQGDAVDKLLTLSWALWQCRSYTHSQPCAGRARMAIPCRKIA